MKPPSQFEKMRANRVKRDHLTRLQMAKQWIAVTEEMQKQSRDENARMWSQQMAT